MLTDEKEDPEAEIKAELLFIPYVDDNESVIMFNNKNVIGDHESRYPQT